MRTTRISISIDVAFAERAAERLMEEGIAFQQQDATTLDRPPEGQVLLTVYALPGEATTVVAQVEVALLDAGIESRIGLSACEEEAWRDTWKVHFKPLVVGPFAIVPSWETFAATAGQTVIDLDPGRAFGTGGHASTRLCLWSLGQLPTCQRFLDVGSGSGLLAIACARRWPGASGVAIDVDPEAVEVTIENAVKNGVAARIATSTTPLDAVAGEFDVVLANLTAETVTSLAAGLASHLTPGGHLIASGILTEQADAVVAALVTCGLRLVTSEDEDEWRGLVLTR